MWSCSSRLAAPSSTLIAHSACSAHSENGRCRERHLPILRFMGYMNGDDGSVFNF